MCCFGMSFRLRGKLEGYFRNSKNGYLQRVVGNGGGERNRRKIFLNFQSFIQLKVNKKGNKVSLKLKVNGNK